MGKIIRFIISVICSAIAFFVSAAIILSFFATASSLILLIVPMILALAVFCAVQMLLGIFRIKNLYTIGIIVMILSVLGKLILSFFN